MSDWLRKCFAGVASHAMPDRPAAAAVAGAIFDNAQLAEARGHRPYLTITNLTERRGKQHRNTARDAMRALERIGFIKVWPARLEGGERAVWSYKFVIKWAAVKLYAQTHSVLSMAGRRSSVQAQARQARADDRAMADRERQVRDQAAARAADEHGGGGIGDALAEIGDVGREPSPMETHPAPDPEAVRRQLRALRGASE